MSIYRFNIFLALVLAGACCLNGCAEGASWLSPNPALGHSRFDKLEATSRVGSSLFPKNVRSDVRVVDLIFDVVKVELPIDGARDSRKIWNHVNPLALDAERVVSLARNALRVGVAPVSAWPAIRTILQAAKVDVRREHIVAQPGLPLVIQLAPIMEQESIFGYFAEGRLVGKTVSAGDKLLSIDYAFHPQLGGTLDVELRFEVRRNLGVMTFEHRDGAIRQVPTYERHVFANLGATLSLATDEFLVIGVDPDQENEYLVGNRFLVRERSTGRFETLFFITPKPFQARVAQQASR